MNKLTKTNKLANHSYNSVCTQAYCEFEKGTENNGDK